MPQLKLTEEVLARFVGGQFEVQCGQIPGEGRMERGPIVAARIEGTELVLEFAWLAKLEPEGWAAAENKPYRADLRCYGVRDVDGRGRLMIASQITGELGVFFPPGGSALAKERVRGLQ